MTTSNKFVYILILNWNGWKDTIECIVSCQKLSYTNYRILIIDNGSEDGSELIIRKQFPDIPLIQTGSNLGFAGGNNVGIRQALAHGADYVWLLNNDTIVKSDALDELVNAAERDSITGIVGSKIYYHEDPVKIWFAGGIWRANRAFNTHRGYNEYDHGQYNTVQEVDYITGCSLLIKSSVINAIGLMHEEYFLYWEETDWNTLAYKNGWKIIYVPSSIVWHKISSTIKNDSYQQIYYYIRNGLLFFQRHEPKRLFYLFAHVIYHTLRLYKKGNINSAKAYRDGIKDFILRRFGKQNTTGTNR